VQSLAVPRIAASVVRSGEASGRLTHGGGGGGGGLLCGLTHDKYSDSAGGKLLGSNPEFSGAAVIHSVTDEPCAQQRARVSQTQ
jgi:hypothetical protein